MKRDTGWRAPQQTCEVTAEFNSLFDLDVGGSPFTEQQIVIDDCLHSNNIV